MLDIFWLEILSSIILSITGVGYASNAYAVASGTVIFELPATYLQVASVLEDHVADLVLFTSLSRLVGFGLTLRNMLIHCALRIILPLVLAVAMFRRRDRVRQQSLP